MENNNSKLEELISKLWHKRYGYPITKKMLRVVIILFSDPSIYTQAGLVKKESVEYYLNYQREIESQIRSLQEQLAEKEKVITDNSNLLWKVEDQLAERNIEIARLKEECRKLSDEAQLKVHSLEKEIERRHGLNKLKK